MRFNSPGYCGFELRSALQSHPFSIALLYGNFNFRIVESMQEHSAPTGTIALPGVEPQIYFYATLMRYSPFALSYLSDCQCAGPELNS